MVNASSDALWGVAPGAFVGVVGPSGAGKDSVIAGAQALLCNHASIVFPQRVVTWAPDVTESNVNLSAREFEVVLSAGGFSLAWAAHGLSYGIPVEVDALVAHGRTVVVNVSRSVAPVLRTRYSRGRVVLIDAPQPVRRSRLAQRGREDDPAINGRLVREVDTFSSADADIVINNSKSIVESARALADYLASLTTLAVPVRTA